MLPLGRGREERAGGMVDVVRALSHSQLCCVFLTPCERTGNARKSPGEIWAAGGARGPPRAPVRLRAA